MITAHPMVKGSFASNPNSVKVRQAPAQHYNAAYAASEAVMDKEDAIRGSNKLAIELRLAFIKMGVGNCDNHYDCIGIHRANIKSLPKRQRKERVCDED